MRFLLPPGEGQDEGKKEESSYFIPSPSPGGRGNSVRAFAHRQNLYRTVLTGDKLRGHDGIDLLPVCREFLPTNYCFLTGDSQFDTRHWSRRDGGNEPKPASVYRLDVTRSFSLITQSLPHFLDTRR